MVTLTGPAEREANEWKQIREIETRRRGLRDLDMFLKTAKFAGMRLPISIRPETFEYFEMKLVDDLLRLGNPAS